MTTAVIPHRPKVDFFSSDCFTVQYGDKHAPLSCWQRVLIVVFSILLVGIGGLTLSYYWRDRLVQRLYEADYQKTQAEFQKTNPSVEKSGVSSTMIKIAFLFLVTSHITHESVWQNFFKGNDERCSIYIHSKDSLDPASAFKQHEMATKVATTWERTMRAQVAILKEALKDPSNEKFVFVSGDSVPIQKFDFVYQQLMQHSLSVFNYSWNNHQDPDSTFYYPKRKLEGISYDKQFKNSQWVVLSRKHAQMMVDDDEVISRVVQSTCDNEHYPSTFLAMQNLLSEVVNQPTMLTLWHRGYAHPFTFSDMDDRYQTEQLTEAMNQGVLFARKFDKQCDVEKLQNLIDKYARKVD
jgi:hypothetical protein